MEMKLSDVSANFLYGACVGACTGCAAAATIAAWPITLSVGAGLGAFSAGAAYAACHQLKASRTATLVATFVIQFFFTLGATLLLTTAPLPVACLFGSVASAYSVAATVALIALIIISDKGLKPKERL